MSENYKELCDKIKELEKDFSAISDYVENKTSKNDKKVKTQRIVIICITVLLICSLLLNAFTIHEMRSYEKVEEEVTETYDIDQNANDDGSIINGNQYNSSTHNESSD
jgi:hypothetical protein